MSVASISGVIVAAVSSTARGAVLVASPNDGTPLATPKRWDETVGWMANLLELFPDNPFTTGAAFVANGLVWLANHALGDLPGLHSMDGRGDVIGADPACPGPPADAYSALVANYEPTGDGFNGCWTSASIGSSRPLTTSSSRPRAAGASIARTRVHSGDADRLLRTRRQPAGRLGHAR